jgi:hypothetical protein
MASKYTRGGLIGDVRLTDWPAGQAAQLKTAVQKLEAQLNTTMASQVNQGQKRVFNPKVPKVTGLTVNPGFKNFHVFFNAAKGITDLLFYEIQKDSTSSFANPIVYTQPQTTLTIPTTAEHETVFFRVRVLNSQFEVGPWSSTQSATGSSNFRISVTRQARQATLLPWATPDIWIDVASATYSPSAASMCINTHAGVYTQNSSDTDIFNTLRYGTSNFNYVFFQILRNGVVLTNAGTMELVGQADYLMHANSEDVQWFEARTEEAEIGTIVTPFETFIGNEVSVTYVLQAKLDTLSGNPSTRTATNRGVANTDDAIVVVDCFDVIEIVQSF